MRRFLNRLPFALSRGPVCLINHSASFLRPAHLIRVSAGLSIRPTLTARSLSTAQKQQQITPRVDKLIKSAIEKYPIVLFMKGTPGYPQCGFSRLVVQILNLSGQEGKYHAIDVLEDEDLRQGIKEFSNWPTIPQVYVKGEFIGGADIMRSMYESGELRDLLSKHGLLQSSEEKK